MYTNQNTIEAYLKRSLTSYETTLIATAIPAVKSFIDAWCNRTFEPTAASRYYDGNGKKSLFIEDFNDITEVIYVDEDLDDNGDALTVGDDYVERPYNADYVSELTVRGGVWVKGTKNVKVTGSYGRASVPDAIKMVATQLVATLLSNPQNLKQRSIEGYSEVYGNILEEPNRNLLDSFTKPML